MQTPIPLIQPASASPASTAPKGTAPKAAAPAPEQQFQRTLSRQIEQRQALTQSQNQAQSKASDARTRADAKAAPAATPSKTAPATPAPQTTAPPAAPAEAKPAEASAKPDGDANDEHVDAATQPLSDMLMLVASLQQAATILKGQAADSQLADAGNASDRSATVLRGVGTASDKAALLLGADTGSDKAALLTAKPDSVDVKLAASLPSAATTLPKAGVLDAALPGTANLAMPTAQAALQITQAASAVTTDKLNGQVGSPAWDQQLGQKVIWMAAGGMQSATLTLNPPDLGPLQVVLNVSNDQATVNFTSNQPEVRQALEAAMPKLREMMGEAGVSLGHTSVSSGNASEDHGGARQESARQSGAATGDSALAQTISVPAARGTALQGMVDTFA
jgi:flagellar hook-length control protein FliK